MIRDPASFRDPAATVWRRYDGKLCREIKPEYFPVYDQFMEKVYPELIDQELIIPHRIIGRKDELLTIEPEIVPFISYPYEWTFETLKKAALVTLKINEIALDYGLMLKDASAYNIQSYQGRMRLIDTTSFMRYSGDTPWPSYSQFLRHFVCPLLWIKYYNPSLGRLSEIYLDGIPVPLTARMLPMETRLIGRFWSHIFFQSGLIGIFKEDFVGDHKRQIKMSNISLKAFLADLYKFVSKLNYSPVMDAGWLKYAEAGSYSKISLESKKEIVAKCLTGVRNGLRVLDLGANTGVYSRLAVELGYTVLAVDSDHDCLLLLKDEHRILPLVVDLCNPSPAIGWGNQERRAFWDRVGNIGTIMALALVHHLSVRNNIPLGMVAELLAAHTDNLIIEWVPLEDKQAQKLLGEKKIPEYSLPVFLAEFGRRFKSIRAFPIKDSGRVIYLMEGKNGLAG